MHISRGIYICIFISILSLLLRTIGLKSETFGTRWLRDGKILSRTDDYIFIFNILVVSRGKENECFKYVLIEKRWIQLYEDFLRNGYGKKKVGMNFQFVVPIRMRPIWISLHFSFQFYNCFHIKKGKKYRYLSIGNFLRFFVSLY